MFNNDRTEQKTNKINWFPGHMTKALREMEKNIKLIDVIIYTLDARAPFSCVNPEFTKLIRNKPIIYVLNKSDLADDRETKSWSNFFTTEKSICVILNSKETNSTKILTDKITKLLSSKIEKYSNKGVSVVNRAMVIGVPNSGKSTLINNFCGKYKAITGNKPGVTQGKQWVRISNNIELLDTPGTLWPDFENQSIAKNLAFIGSIRDEVLDIPSLSLDLIALLQERYPQFLEERYGISLKDTPLEILEQICEARKFLIKGGEFDYDRASHALFDDFRKGRIGKITLEKVEDYAQKEKI